MVIDDVSAGHSLLINRVVDPAPSLPFFSPRESMAVIMSELVSAVEGGDRRKSLEAIRDKLAVELSAAEGRDAAAVAKELRATIAELEGLPDGKERSAVDELASRRADRLADAAGR
ncbi:hypothetical protein [Nonomuraea sp. NPDC049480]|uniref:hypothetical protein n=1 Tax=Nonomuraea sp. NPDC049480 TaxID=3364353 RepID=UPI0037A33759